MSYPDFLAELQKIGRDPNSLPNYASHGELPTHIALIAVLAVSVAEKNGDYRQIMPKIVLTPKKPCGSAKRGRFGGYPQQAMDF